MMITHAKILIPKKEWILKNNSEKLGSVIKEKKGFSFLKKGNKIKFHNMSEIESQLGIKIPDNFFEENQKKSMNDDFIYDFPCSSKPYSPVFNIKKKLPLFYKSSKSKSQYCAGYYIIKFKQRWVKSFCPKLITIERCQFKGPFKTEAEIKNLVYIMNKL